MKMWNIQPPLTIKKDLWPPMKLLWPIVGVGPPGWQPVVNCNCNYYPVLHIYPHAHDMLPYHVSGRGQMERIGGGWWEEGRWGEEGQMEEQQNLIDLLIVLSQCFISGTWPAGHALVKTQWSPDLSTTFISGEERDRECVCVCMCVWLVILTHVVWVCVCVLWFQMKRCF